MIVVIDPGHGGDTKIGGSSPNNATGPNGLLEKNATLDIASRLHHLLEQGAHRTILTRDTDRNLALRDRAEVAHDSNADVFLAIHFNGFDDPTVQGTETFIHRDASDESKRFAEAVQQRTVAATGYRNRGVKREGFGVLRPTRHLASTVACLAELSFMTDPDEAARLMTEAYKNSLAEALRDAIADFEAN